MGERRPAGRAGESPGPGGLMAGMWLVRDEVLPFDGLTGPGLCHLRVYDETGVVP